ncbi:hypothetical protein C8J56DRAFT_450809 [Mycena floridula]|nr:hypothetical protein C8J56DRAFT_450809 [Mycena floridula]
MSATQSPALTNLVAFLTRPLLLSYPRTTVLKAQLVLEAGFMSLFPAHQPFKFVFSTQTATPSPFVAACQLSGISWAKWVGLFGGQDIHFFVSERSIKIAINEDGTPSLNIWQAESTAVSRLRQTVESAQSRRSSPAPDDEESDSDSDTDSTTSSLFSSAESMTSVSSTSSSIKPSILMKQSCPVPRYQPPNQRRLAQQASKKPVTNYMYQGGSTGVVTGGVMLSGAKITSPGPKPRTRPALSSSDSWRRS